MIIESRERDERNIKTTSAALFEAQEVSWLSDKEEERQRSQVEDASKLEPQHLLPPLLKYNNQQQAIGCQVDVAGGSGSANMSANEISEIVGQSLESASQSMFPINNNISATSQCKMITSSSLSWSPNNSTDIISQIYGYCASVFNDNRRPCYRCPVVSNNMIRKPASNRIRLFPAAIAIGISFLIMLDSFGYCKPIVTSTSGRRTDLSEPANHNEGQNLLKQPTVIPQKSITQDSSNQNSQHHLDKQHQQMLDVISTASLLANKQDESMVSVVDENNNNNNDDDDGETILLVLASGTSSSSSSISAQPPATTLRRLIKRSGISDQRLAEIQMIRALKKQLERASKLTVDSDNSGGGGGGDIGGGQGGGSGGEKKSAS